MTETSQERIQETPEETLARRNKFQRMMGLPELKNLVTVFRDNNLEVVYLTGSYIPQTAPEINYEVLQETGEQR